MVHRHVEVHTDHGSRIFPLHLADSGDVEARPRADLGSHARAPTGTRVAVGRAGSRAATSAVRSANRQAYPYSLSYQLTIFARSPITSVSRPLKIEDRESPFRSMETSGSSV